MEDGDISTAESTKSDCTNSPVKPKKSLSESSTNLDKVIEAVSKGILDDSHNLNEFNHNHIENRPMKVNGVQTKLNDSKSPIKSSESKIKPNKKSKKEKERDKDKGKDKDKDKDMDKGKEKEKDMEKDKVKVKEKEKDKDKEKNKDKEKIKVKEKTKRKEGSKSVASKKHDNSVDLLSNDESEKTKEFRTENSAENSLSANLVISIKDLRSQPTEKQVNGDISTVVNPVQNGNIEDITTTSRVTENEAERKQSRKRRKEKHRNKHGLDSDRPSSKEHKKKRKRKSHDHENPAETFPLADGVPKIKIKVCQA